MTVTRNPIKSSIRRSRLCHFALVLLVGLCGFGLETQASPANETKADPEYRVKALFMYKAAHWIQWPTSNLPDSAKTIIVGVVGTDPFGKDLDLIEKLKPINGRNVEVVRFDTVAKVKDVQVLFVSSSLSEADEEKVLVKAKDDGFVTFSERKKFADRGGMFNLLIVDNKVTFEANPGAAKEAEIKISSQLLKLAHRIVKKDS